MSNEPRALIYLRVSTDRQAQKGIALPTQQERCLAYARETGYRVEKKTDIYVDEGESARTMDRPALMDLLTRCKEDKAIRAVIVYDVSRLARNRLDFALIKQTLRKSGVTFLSATEPINDTPEGQMLEGVLSTVAEFFSAQSGRKVQANMRRKAEMGGWPNLAPYGYLNRKEKLATGEIRAWIEPRPEEARWVVRAFELFATGRYSVKTLTKTLNTEGFAVRPVRNRKSKLLHHSQLERLLRNKIYVGFIEWAGVVNEHGTHAAIIDPDTFYRVQDLLRTRSGSTSRERRYKSLFKKISWCDECRCTMTIDVKETSASRAIRYLRCRKVHQGKRRQCDQAYFAEEVYAGQLEALMGRVELSSQAVENLCGKLQRISGEEESVYSRVREGILRELEAVKRRQQNLLVRSLDEDINNEAHRSIYERVRSELAGEHERLTIQLRRVRVRLDRIAKILAMALEIAGCVSRAFAVDEDPDYRGLIARVIFRELRMRDGEIVGAKASTPLAFFRRWIGEKPLECLSDLALLCAPNSPLVDGCESCQKRYASAARIRKDLVRLEKLITPEEEAKIETCYYELRGRSLLRSTEEPRQPKGT
jgi:DNA invertase Pin-like site-specific DNA recombinase